MVQKHAVSVTRFTRAGIKKSKTFTRRVKRVKNGFPGGGTRLTRLLLWYYGILPRCVGIETN
jgi:uncharacterized protein with GYD domain